MEFSICGTVYNNANRVRGCLDSVLVAMRNFNYEIIIVDNYSSDGTFEILKKYANEYEHFTITREKCSRGKGRQMSLKLTRGRYVIPIDLDVYYIPRIFSLMVQGYLRSSFKDIKCMTTMGPGATGVYPRHLLEKVGGWRDINWYDDVDLHTRLFLLDLAVNLPVIVGLDEEYMGQRERRYAKDPLRYMLRWIRNKRDMALGNADNVRKIINLCRALYRFKIYKTLLVCLRVQIIKTINDLTGLKSIHGDPNIPNLYYFAYRKVMTSINPLDLGFSPEDISTYDYRLLPNYIVEYTSMFYPEIIDKLKKIRSWEL